MDNIISISKSITTEFLQVYPPVKEKTDLADNNKYLSFFSKASYKVTLSNVPVYAFESRKKVQDPSKNLTNNSKTLEKEEEKEEQNEKEKNLNEIYDCYLIEKDIHLRKNKSRRTADIRYALGNFFRKSEPIEKIRKFFEEFQQKSLKLKNVKNKKEDTKNDEEKFFETYIETMIAKLAENVVFEKYKKNEYVIKMNEIGEDCYFLVGGKLSVLKPVEYHIEITYDEYMIYLTNLIKNNEQELINTIRQLNQHIIDLGLVEDLKDFIKSYFIIKLNKDINKLYEAGKFSLSFVEHRFNLFNLRYEDFNFSKEEIDNHIKDLSKRSLIPERDIKDYLKEILKPRPEHFKMLKSNPHIFDENKVKMIIYKYEDFLYLMPGCLFGEVALDSAAHKRNATIRAEEDCIILSLKNELYQALLSDNNKKLKSFDVVFICRNFFFNDISPVIFNRRYFSLFKLNNNRKDDIIYKQSEKLSSIYFIQEGNVKLEIYASIIDIFNLIRYYYDSLISNNNLKINHNILKEIRENYVEDKKITSFRHQSYILREQLKVKRKFELYTSNSFDTLGLEEYFLNKNYICTCKIISNDAKIFELEKDSLDLIVNKEKQINGAFYQLIERKLISLIKRLYVIKKTYINQLNYKIKENFFNTEIPPEEVIKGQTGTKKTYSRCINKKSEPKLINSFYKKEKEIEEIKNDDENKKLNLKLIIKNKNSDNDNSNDGNKKEKEKDNENSIKKSSKRKEKRKKINIKISLPNDNKFEKKYLDKNNLMNSIFSKIEEDKNVAHSIKKKNKRYKSEINFNRFNINKNDSNKNNLVENDMERKRRIMETTIIRVGNDYLSLKEIGKRIKSHENENNSELSIVKNFYSKKSNDKLKNIPLFYSARDKKYNRINIFEKNFKSEPNFKNNISALSNNKFNLYNNKLPNISINSYNNFTNLFFSKIKQNEHKIKNDNSIFQSFKFDNKNNILKNNYRTFYDNKNSFNVILTTKTNPILRGINYSNKKRK